MEAENLGLLWVKTNPQMLPPVGEREEGNASPGCLRSTWVNGVEAEALAWGGSGWGWMVGRAGLDSFHRVWPPARVGAALIGNLLEVSGWAPFSKAISYF